MATRGRATFQKRQKELARKDKQQRKNERREQRKLERTEADKFPPQDPAFPSEPESERTELVGAEQPPGDLRTASRGQSTP